MIGIFFAVAGFIWGYVTAQKRGGNRLDRLQYGAGFAIAFGLVGTFFGIALVRFLVP